MTIEPKMLKDLESKQERLVSRMYRHKTLYLKNKARLPQLAERIMEIKQKQTRIST
ncbi:hypothetical protein [uncultured Mediterranean phage uvMED]|jgi:hypothetical protein|nr:hypothetical protein [uncultured Mediterranean phage uvMED]